MILIPLEYLKKYLSLPPLTPSKLAEKLTYFGLETSLIEKNQQFYLEINPLPNRPDLLSWWGIVQEIGIGLNIGLNCPLKPINFPIINEQEEKLIEVAISTDNCSEFYLGLIKDIKVKESPNWIKEWLKINNIHCINNVVDSANLVMLETGQLLHIFDYDTLPEKKLVVRQARPGEKINTLHHQELVLNSEDVVISSEGKIISLAGIIGDQTTSLTSHTKNILIECAFKKTTNRLKVSTAASNYFSRRANLVLTPQQVLARVISLIIETYQGDLNSGIIYPYHKLSKTALTVAISQEFITKKIGQELSEKVVENIWKRLQFSYQKKGDAYYIEIPLSRTDITIPEDLLEELLRIYDYNQVISSESLS